MSEENQALLDVAKTATAEQIQKVIAAGKTQFVDLFKGVVSKDDLEFLVELFDRAHAAKAAHFGATTPEQSADLEDEYQAYMDAIETLADKYLIVGKAKLGVLARSLAHQIISGAFAVGGAVLQAALTAAIPGVGALVGAGVNAGLQHLVAYFLGD